MAKLKRIDACDLSRLIEQVYGREFNVPAVILGGQRQQVVWIEAFAAAEDPDCRRELADFRQTGKITSGGLAFGLFETMLNDLCAKGKLEAGESVLEFSD